MSPDIPRIWWPLADKLFIRRTTDEADTEKGGILIPDAHQEIKDEGIVTAIGPEVTKYAKGDTVLIPRRSFGQTLETDGVKVFVIKEADIHGRVILPKCEDCGCEGDQVELTNCPFQDDVYNKTVSVTLCPSCFHERLMDI